MKISHIEHIGIAVNSIEEALPFYENVLGFECYKTEEVADQKVKTAFLKVGDTKLELLEPTSPDSTVAKFLETRGPDSITWPTPLRMALLMHSLSAVRNQSVRLTLLQEQVPTE